MPLFTKRQLTLLIVEDDEIVAKYLSTVLKDLFSMIEVVVSMRDAITRIAGNHIDVVLLDLTLTNGAGLTPIQKLRAMYPHLPIIVMTGGEVGADEAMACGACDFLHKTSMNVEDIFAAVVKSVARRRAFQQTAALSEAADQLTAIVEEGKAKIAAGNSVNLPKGATPCLPATGSGSST